MCTTGSTNTYTHRGVAAAVVVVEGDLEGGERVGVLVVVVVQGGDRN